MSEFPGAAYLYKIPFYLIAIIVIGVFAYAFLIFLLLWKWFFEKPYEKYRKWKSGKEDIP